MCCRSSSTRLLQSELLQALTTIWRKESEQASVDGNGFLQVFPGNLFTPSPKQNPQSSRIRRQRYKLFHCWKWYRLEATLCDLVQERQIGLGAGVLVDGRPPPGAGWESGGHHLRRMAGELLSPQLRWPTRLSWDPNNQRRGRLLLLRFWFFF